MESRSRGVYARGMTVEENESNPVSAALHYPRLTPVAWPIQMQSRKAKPDAGARPERSRGEQLVQKTTAPP